MKNKRNYLLVAIAIFIVIGIFFVGEYGWKKINDKDNNHTKFIIIGRKLESSNECNKITVVFSLDDKSGTLYNLLRHFAENNINMIKIESRPSKNEPWQYLLYVDFEGNVENDDVKKAIKLIEGKSEYFKLLGNYKKVSC